MSVNYYEEQRRLNEIRRRNIDRDDQIFGDRWNYQQGVNMSDVVQMTYDHSQDNKIVSSENDRAYADRYSIVDEAKSILLTIAKPDDVSIMLDYLDDATLRHFVSNSKRIVKEIKINKYKLTPYDFVSYLTNDMTEQENKLKSKSDVSSAPVRTPPPVRAPPPPRIVPPSVVRPDFYPEYDDEDDEEYDDEVDNLLFINQLKREFQISDEEFGRLQNKLAANAHLTQKESEIYRALLGFQRAHEMQGLRQPPMDEYVRTPAPLVDYDERPRSNSIGEEKKEPFIERPRSNSMDEEKVPDVEDINDTKIRFLAPSDEYNDITLILDDTTTTETGKTIKQQFESLKFSDLELLVEKWKLNGLLKPDFDVRNRAGNQKQVATIRKELFEAARKAYLSQTEQVLKPAKLSKNEYREKIMFLQKIVDINSRAINDVKSNADINAVVNLLKANNGLTLTDIRNITNATTFTKKKKTLQNIVKNITTEYFRLTGMNEEENINLVEQQLKKIAEEERNREAKESNKLNKFQNINDIIDHQSSLDELDVDDFKSLLNKLNLREENKRLILYTQGHLLVSKHLMKKRLIEYANSVIKQKLIRQEENANAINVYKQIKANEKVIEQYNNLENVASLEHILNSCGALSERDKRILKATPKPENKLHKLREILKFAIESYNEIPQEEVQGNGLRFKKHLKKPKIYGRGMSVETQTNSQTSRYKKDRKYFDKIYIDLGKLKKNILFCKYIINNSNIPKLKTQTIDNDCKEVILDIIGDKFSERIYNRLDDKNKRIVRNFIRAFKFDLNVNDNEDDEFNKQFQILLGSYYSGNDSPEIRTQLKRYVRQAIAENLISQKESLSLLYELG